jgi:hypothetical protein
VNEALHVFAKAKNGGTLPGFIAADAFEYGGAVAHDVGEHVKGGVVPIDPLSVVPDLIGLLDWHKLVLF